MHLCEDCGLSHPTYTHDGKCTHCGASLVSYSDALQNAGKCCGAVEGSHGACSPNAVEDGIMRWRHRCYSAEKWLSRLLGIGLNQAAGEAEKRLGHPLGLDIEPEGLQVDWQIDWTKANIRILRGAIARLEATIAGLEKDQQCRCADCRGVPIDLDSEIPDIEGSAEKTKGSSTYMRVTPEGEVL